MMQIQLESPRRGAHLDAEGLQLLGTKVHVEGGAGAGVVHAEHQQHPALGGFCKSPKEP